jgi:hypothetical protein
MPGNRAIESIGSFLPALLDEFFERQCAVVLFIVSGIDKGNLAFLALRRRTSTSSYSFQ